MPYVSYSEWLPVKGARLYTSVCLPDKEGQFPTVIYRSPYVDHLEHMSDEELCAHMLESHKVWLDNGYAIVYQHCRGRGHSEGDCIPYIYEREDGLALYDWVRGSSFYNGELYLCGGSYTTSVHYVTAPFASDIKGAVFEVQDTERYNLNFRNGFYKIGLHGGWYVDMYKRKSGLKKAYVPESYHMLPLSDFSKTVFGEKDDNFDEVLMHPDKSDPFWDSELGGGHARHALRHANIPILLITAFYDIYTGGIFDMWNELDEETRQKCAMAVHPYEHSGMGIGQPILFDNGNIHEQYPYFQIKWLNYVRGKGEPPFAPGKVTYYKLFGDKWCCDDFETPTASMDIPVGTETVTYAYNPYAPASFKGGLSANFDGTAYQDPPNSRYDILSFYTPEFQEDILVKGKMKAKLCVSSDCEDTCFYVRLSLAKKEGDYGLRDDIHAISNFAPDYVPGSELMMDFSFDEHAFVIHKGERLRIDISSSAFPWYVRHTNNRGHFATQTDARIARNTVMCDRSYITIFYE